MSATREYRNLGMLEDAIASIGMTITIAEHLLDALAGNLPDGTEGPLRSALDDLRERHDALGAAAGLL